MPPEVAVTQIIEAVYEGGVLRPAGPLSLREHQRVRVIVEDLAAPTEEDRARARNEAAEAALAMGFKSTGPYPTRDELHDRH